MIDTVIVSGGNIQTGFALDFLRKLQEKQETGSMYFIAADKGLEFFMNAGIIPHEAVGDFDSISEKGKAFLSAHKEILVKKLKPEKDDSDTQSALHLAKERGATDVLILGATGTRLDHVIANVELLLWGKELGISVALADANNYICLAENGMQVKKEEQFGKYISFFPLGGEVNGLTLEGFYYPLKNYTLTARDCGLTVSNELKDETGKIFYDSGHLMMIMSRD